MKPRILFVLPLDGGSLVVARHVADALKERSSINAETVATQPLYAYYKKQFLHLSTKEDRIKNILQLINLEVLKKAVAFRPDFILVMALAPIAPWLIEEFRKIGAMTAHWYVEDLRYFPANPVIPKWQIVASCYDHFFTIQKNAFDYIGKNAKVRNVHYLPTGCNPAVQSGKRFQKMLSRFEGMDISFIGHPYPNRVVLFQQLDEFDLSLWGPGWTNIPKLKQFVKGNGNWIDPCDESEILRSSKIGLNIHSTFDGPAIIRKGDFLNPRVFTIAACGAFQLVDQRDGLEEAFDVGVEIAVYADVADLKEKVRYFLNNEGERKRMAENAKKRAIGEHTYERRLDKMFEMVNVVG